MSCPFRLGMLPAHCGNGCALVRICASLCVRACVRARTGWRVVHSRLLVCARARARPHMRVWDVCPSSHPGSICRVGGVVGDGGGGRWAAAAASTNAHFSARGKNLATEKSVGVKLMKRGSENREKRRGDGKKAKKWNTTCRCLVLQWILKCHLCSGGETLSNLQRYYQSEGWQLPWIC